MVIYGNNLHEKLQGIALSKDYIKYATPFCDFVDDPELAPDIDLAINYNQAINGDPIAVTRFTDTLILSGYLFDSSTKEYYRNRMLSNTKVWGDRIKYTKLGFETGNIFLDALNDCLNSPCNLFAETSDSIARLSQVASTKNGSNSFSVGDLSATFINITNGLDEAVTKKLPTIFGGAALELTQNVKTARSNIEAVVAGKKNLNQLKSLANASGSMRGTEKIYRYTPDLKSYTDYNNLGNNILLKVKQKLGGCFDRFEAAYRYNPYEDNTSVPATDQKRQYNGEEYTDHANGTPKPKSFLSKFLNLFGFGGDNTSDLQDQLDDVIKQRETANMTVEEFNEWAKTASPERVKNEMDLIERHEQLQFKIWNNDDATIPKSPAVESPATNSYSSTDGRTVKELERDGVSSPGYNDFGNGSIPQAKDIGQLFDSYGKPMPIDGKGDFVPAWADDPSVAGPLK